VKFTETGSVRIKVSSDPQSITNGQPSIGFSVTDTGIGIPPEKLAAIFDSFQQAGEDTTARFGGTGLGLTIARELVQLYGSDIQVASQVGKGSTFSFVLALPLADTEDLKTNSTKGDILHFTQPLRILLADDNTLNLEIATEAIRRHFENVEIVEAKTGKEAVAQFQSGAFDLILMDMQMPEMSGTEATRYIRQQLSSDIPIIALTASATPEEIENALESGMNRHLGKPFKPMELAQVVAEVLGLEGSVLATKVAEKHRGSAANTTGTDLAFLRDFCDGDEVQMRHFIQKFLERYPLEIKRLEDALAQEDREALYQAAHSFRPQLEFMGLSEAAEQALLLERGAREGLPVSTLMEFMKQINASLDDLPKVDAW
jgi:CheY-like chemotaxis protein/HPt (histidine-containing phosphotransfer) domain-containing protein